MPVLIFKNRSNVDTGLMLHKKRKRETVMGLIGKWFIENWLSILIGGILIQWLAFNVIPNWWNNNVSVIEISPKTKNIVCSSSQFRKETFYIYLTNKSSKPIYDINVIAHHPEEVVVDLCLEEEHPEAVSVGNISVGTAFSIYQSTVTQTVINNLAPGETVKLKVEVNMKDYLNNFELKTEVKSFSKTPKPIFTTR